MSIAVGDTVEQAVDGLASPHETALRRECEKRGLPVYVYYNGTSFRASVYPGDEAFRVDVRDKDRETACARALAAVLVDVS